MVILKTCPGMCLEFLTFQRTYFLSIISNFPVLYQGGDWISVNEGGGGGKRRVGSGLLTPQEGFLFG